MNTNQLTGKRFMQMRKYMHGITLMELMIVVVIVGILAAVAYPNYREFAARAKRNEARAALLQIATNQERFYLQNNTFTTDMVALGFPNDPFTTDSGSYTVSVGAADATYFTATATFLLGDTESTKCLTFTIDGRGAKTSTPDTDCWSRSR
jgi:type IV pilus assembly protein PilE